MTDTAIMEHEAKKIEQILALAKLDILPLNDINWIVDTQDILNCSGDVVREVVQSLNSEGRRRLLWVVSSVSGIDTFNFYLEHGFWPNYIERHNSRLKEQGEELQQWEDRISGQVNRYREKHGREVNGLRQQVKNLQQSLELEQKKNRKFKALIRIIKRGINL